MFGPESFRLFLRYALLPAATKFTFPALDQEMCLSARTTLRKLNAWRLSALWREEPKICMPLLWLDLPIKVIALIQGWRAPALPLSPSSSICFVLHPLHALFSCTFQCLPSLHVPPLAFYSHNYIFSYPLTMLGLCPGFCLLPPGTGPHKWLWQLWHSHSSDSAPVASGAG